jgi:hypothetical protein
MLEYCWKTFGSPVETGGLPRNTVGPSSKSYLQRTNEFKSTRGENSATDVTMSIAYASFWVEMSLK